MPILYRKVSVLYQIAAVIGLAAGCSEGTNPGEDARGKYNLATVNGQSLPVTTTLFSGVNAVLLNGHVELTEGFWVAKNTHRYLNQTAEFSSGSVGTFYEVKGTALTLKSSDGVTWNGTLSGNTLTLQLGSNVVVYQRE